MSSRLSMVLVLKILQMAQYIYLFKNCLNTVAKTYYGLMVCNVEILVIYIAPLKRCKLYFINISN